MKSVLPLLSLVSLLPQGGQALAAGLHPEIMRAWLDTQTGAPPEEIAAAIKAQLKRAGVIGSFRVRLKMLDVLVEQTRRITEIFESDLNKAQYPLSPALKRKVVIGNDLLKYHAKCYRAAIEKLKGSWLIRGNSRLLRRSLMNAMDLERRRLILAFRAYAPGSKSAWKNLHSQNRIAREEGIAAQASADSEDSPHQLYVKTLLLALAEPEQMEPGELDRVRFYLDRYAGLAELTDLTRFRRDPESREGCFLIRQNEEGPGRSLRKWQNLEIQAGDLLLDCGPLLRKLRSQINALEQGALPSKIGLPTVARRPQYVTMLKNLHTLWSAPPMRGSHRQHFKPRVELAVGLDDLWALLSGASLNRRHDDLKVKSAQTQTIGLSEWSVANESPTGFALQYLNGTSQALSVGALVGLRSQDRSKPQICFARRLVSGEQRSVELGLEKYAPTAVPTIISWNGSAAGKTPTKAIVLPRVPSLGGSAAVIVSPNMLRSGKRVPCVLDGRYITYVTGAPVDRRDNYEIFLLSNPDEEPDRKAPEQPRTRREKAAERRLADDAA